MDERRDHDQTKLEADASAYGSPGDRERAVAQADDVRAAGADTGDRVDPLGRPLSADDERPVATPEAAPHHDQETVRPSERAIGQDVRSASQNGQGITR